MNRQIVQVGIALGLFLIPSAALAGNYQTCIQVETQTVDSGYDIPSGPNTGVSEDNWTSCDSGCNVIARGVRVKVSKGTWSQTTDSDPTTGCFNWSHADSSGFTLTVYGYATNNQGTFVRIHDGAYDDVSTYPGATYSAVITNVTPTNGGSNTYYIGDYVPRWTTFSSAAFGIYRYPYQNVDKEVHIAFDRRNNTDGPCNSSSVLGAQSITSGRAYFFIADPAVGACTKDHSSRKFGVTHELGHCLLRLNTNLNGLEPNFSVTHNETGTANPDACGTGGTGGYTILSKEWNSLGFKEGFAHFIAARIWNERSQTGAFTWIDSNTYDLDRFNQGAGNSSGGRLENICCTSGCSSSWPNAGTNEDWLLFFWDFYNNDDQTCTAVPDSIDMLELYKQVRTNGGLTSTNYFSKMATAVTQIGLDSCLSGSRFDVYAALNGIDN